ncbi:MAG: nucleotide sugar dehydrogenase [Actinobacteria bacterium]|nr:nucleotide sugar dehydrogenase [Actinomycetota bacterium]
MIRQMRVAVIGQGYVGLTISVGSLSAGHEVLGVDLSENLVAALSAGKSHIEGISDVEVAAGVKSGRYTVTSDYQLVDSCEVVVIAVPTPLGKDGAPDLSILRGAAEFLGRNLKSKKLIINESTSHPGTLRNLIKPIVEKNSSHNHLYAISPERVDPGNEKFGTKNTPRVVGGLTEDARDQAISFYRSFCDEVIAVSSAEVAEAAKIFENTFRFINIGLVNEFSQIMGAMGIPVNEVLEAAGTKPYGFMKFHPNVGIGGHCIPVDPMYLQAEAEKLGLPSRYIEISESMNQKMPEYIVGILDKRVGGLRGKRVQVLGVSYKANISDTRETPAEAVIEILMQRGAIVSWHDPLVSLWNGEASSPIDKNADIGLVLAAHNALDLSGWGSAPIYTINENRQHPQWIALLNPTK